MLDELAAVVGDVLGALQVVGVVGEDGLGRAAVAHGLVDDGGGDALGAGVDVLGEDAIVDGDEALVDVLGLARAHAGADALEGTLTGGVVEVGLGGGLELGAVLRDDAKAILLVPLEVARTDELAFRLFLSGSSGCCVAGCRRRRR